jgi:hypothetical protein
MVLLTVISAGCSPHVSTEGHMNPTMAADIGGWHTYDWLPAPEGGDPRVYNQITQSQLETAVDRELAARGFSRDNENPDFHIAWTGSIDRRLDVDYFSRAYSYGWGWWGPGYGYYVDDYDEGTLILDFIDVRRNELAWRGVAQGRLSGSRSQGPTQGQIDEAVEEVMEEFPQRR